MPRAKRFTPISHDFNRDPEIIACRKQFGDWIALAWQECLAIGDRNDGIVRGTLDQIAAILAPISLQKYLGIAAKSARIFLETAANLGWIRVESTHIEIVNHWKYHTKQVQKQEPSYPNLSDPILLRKDKEKNKKEPTPKIELPEWLHAGVWESFTEHRKRIKKPLGPRAITLAFSELDKLRNAGHDPALVIDQSILNGWAGLFAIKPQLVSSNGRHETPADRLTARINRLTGGRGL